MLYPFYGIGASSMRNPGAPHFFGAADSMRNELTSNRVSVTSSSYSQVYFGKVSSANVRKKCNNEIIQRHLSCVSSWQIPTQEKHFVVGYSLAESFYQ
jgi:hypothetical protein